MVDVITKAMLCWVRPYALRSNKTPIKHEWICDCNSSARHLEYDCLPTECVGTCQAMNGRGVSMLELAKPITALV